MVQEDPLGKPLLVAAAELETRCRKEGWRACVIGGLAVLRWGRRRSLFSPDIADGILPKADALGRDGVFARLALLGFGGHFAQRRAAVLVQKVFRAGEA